MKPEDLKPPHKWDERRVLIQDRILYVPSYYDQYGQFHFPGWNDPQIFGNHNPVVVEYCSGNGAWIAAKAQLNPHLNWVAVEMKFERVRKIWSKIKNHQLNNLFIICGEAFTTTRNYFPPESLNAIYINFPDPWPKKRHFKNRLIQTPFVNEMCRVLMKQACMTLVTDDRDYSEWVIETMRSHQGFASGYPDPYYLTDLSDYGDSYFDTLWREKGRTIRFHLFQKQ